VSGVRNWLLTNAITDAVGIRLVPTIGAELPGGNAIQPHLRAPLEGQRPSQLQHARTRRSAVRDSGNAPTDRRNDLHDGATVAVKHAIAKRLRHVPRTVEVEIDDIAPTIRTEIARFGRKLSAGIVDHNVDVTMTFRELLHLLHVADVYEIDIDSPTGERREFLRSNVEYVFATRRDHQIGTGLRKPQRDGASDTRATAGY
jgi:hypothetical protein